jgi:tRNA (guanine-N7-)-methyltransferase
VLLYFPDPWPKTRHHKRRIVQPAFVRLVRSKLEPGGRFELATDWEAYAEHMLEVLEATPGLANVAGPGRFSPRPEHRPRTKFEARGERLGHRVWDLVYERTEGPSPATHGQPGS